MGVPPKEHNPHGAPHLSHEQPPWFAREEKIRKELLKWQDVRQLSVFGRNGYYVANYLFGSLPLQEAELDVWVRLRPEDVDELGRNPNASLHAHRVRGWMTLRVENDKQVKEAVGWLKKAYEAACKVLLESQPKLPGVPIETVPEATGEKSHKIPQGPSSGRFVTGLDSPGAHPQPKHK